jgi:hypothetical protein
MFQSVRLQLGVNDLVKIRRMILILAIFSLGWMLNTVLTNFIYYDAEKPLSFGFVPFLKSPERLSPSDHIKESQIHVYDNKVVIDATGAQWAEFTDTNSMDPFLDETSNSIEVAPQSPADIKVGDIISYKSGLTGGLIVHRVISKDVDDNGIFFIVKGDNNAQQDPEKIRFNQVHGILIGIIY